MNRPKDLYSILGVDRSASTDEIKRAYRKLVRRYHPDLNPGDASAEARFKEISAAYEVLSDPERRRAYDRGEERGGEEEESYAFDLRDIFGEVFGRFRGRARVDDAPVRGADVNAAITISFVESVRGGKREVELELPVACERCGGRGRGPGVESVCSTCGGSGRVPLRGGPIRIETACATCGGTGRIPPPPCSACRGTGVQRGKVRLTVPIPAGIRDGQRVRVPKRGAPGRNGGAPGDLFLTVRVESHPIFRRSGDDLELDLPLTVAEAMFGASVEIPTIDGRVKLEVPRNTQSGTRLRIKGKGVPSLDDGRRGDLYARVVVRVPDPSRDPRGAKKAAEQLDELYAQDVRAHLFSETRS